MDSQTEAVPFSPPTDLPSKIATGRSDIPRYLFRVAGPDSDGTTDERWVSSRDACSDDPEIRDYSSKDYCQRGDAAQVAEELSVHLRGEVAGESIQIDNFVSWTSSLLVALQYAFFRCARETMRQSNLDSVTITIVDTEALPEGVFVRAMDMMNAYGGLGSPSSADLKNLIAETQPKRDSSAGQFAGYLSQGSLRIEGHCFAVTLRAMVDNGLYNLRDDWDKPHVTDNSAWTEAVIKMRKPFSKDVPEPLSDEQSGTIINIAKLFGPPWEVPIAGSLLALLPRAHDDTRVRTMVEELLPNDVSGYRASSTTMAVEHVPELQAFHQVMSARD